MIQTLGERRDARVRREAETAAMRDAVQQAIRIRFPDAPASLIERIERIRSRAALRDLLARAIRAASAEEIEASLPA